MKKILWAGAIASTVLSGCVTAPKIDFATVNLECGKVCQKEELTCKAKYAEVPLLLTAHCGPELNACVKACPAPGEAYVPPTTEVKASADKPSVEERLKQIEDLHKRGVITDKEYADKRQEILKSL
ncbi:MAG: SHOCT domain-containing protein [Gallionellaceae bacterium]